MSLLARSTEVFHIPQISSAWRRYGIDRTGEGMGHESQPLSQGRIETSQHRLQGLPNDLNRHGPEQTGTSITGKLTRNTFADSFLFA